MNSKKLIVFAGPTGVGKSTVMSFLKTNFNVTSPLCFTTRKKRVKEDDEYIFVNNEEFNNLEKRGLFFFVTGEDTKYGFYNENDLDKNVFVLATSYENAIRLKNSNSNTIIITMLYKNINEEIVERIQLRNEIVEDYKKRINYDIKDYNTNFVNILALSSLVVCTSEYSIDEVNKLVSEYLVFNNIIEKRENLKLERK